MLNKIAHFLLPNQCIFCDQKSSPQFAICADCLLALPYQNPEKQCANCGISLNSGENTCNDCLFCPPAFHRAEIPFAYHTPLDSAITQYKYHANLCAGKLLGHLLCEHLKAKQEIGEFERPDVIVPVPMYWKRRWQRGFNHTEPLARVLADHLNIPCRIGLVTRQAAASTQKGLNRAARSLNLQNAFNVNRPEKIKGLSVALVDDVVTTTATARELAQCLIAAGAANVQLWAVARAMRKDETTDGHQ